MWTVTLVQVATDPSWVGPTIAISAALLAACAVAATVGGAVALARASREMRNVRGAMDGLRADLARTLASVDRLAEQGQDVLVVIRQEAGAIAQTSRRLRRRMLRGADQIQERLDDFVTLYDLVHDEMEETALDVAATMRGLRSGHGVLGRVRRLIAPEDEE